MRRLAFVLFLVAASCSEATELVAESPGTPASPSPTSVASPLTPEPVARTKVPKVEGQSAAQAEETLSRANLKVRVEKEYSHDPAGTVIAQNPGPGTRVEEGAVVLVVIAKPFPVIPDVVGLTVNQAERTLRRQGFDARIRRQGTSGTPGTVLAQIPTAGTEARPGRTVTLVIPNCTEGYSPCLPPAPDYDCAGGTGDGPKYTGLVRVYGFDPYGLDADNDGYGCE